MTIATDPMDEVPTQHALNAAVTLLFASLIAAGIVFSTRSVWSGQEVSVGITTWAELSIVLWIILFGIVSLTSIGRRREASTIARTYGVRIYRTHQSITMVLERPSTTDLSIENLLRSGEVFLRETVGARSITRGSDDHTLDAEVAVFAVDLYPHRVTLTISPETRPHLVSMTVETARVLGSSAGYAGGLVILGLWTRVLDGERLPGAPCGREPWREVLHAAARRHWQREDRS